MENMEQPPKVEECLTNTPTVPSEATATTLEEDDLECRVCRGEAEPDRRLYAPCKCSGSIGFTHADCLSEWLAHSGKTFCELCGHQFEFKPLYDANAPEALSYKELIATIAQLTCFKWIPFGMRAILVLVLWLGVAPWCTSWLYRMWLLRASAMNNVNFSERFTVEHVMADVFAGIVLMVVIIFSFLAFMSFADFLRFHLDHIEEQPMMEGWHGVEEPVHEERVEEEGVVVVQERQEEEAVQEQAVDAPVPVREEEEEAAVLRQRRGILRNAEEGVEPIAPIAPAAPLPPRPLPLPRARGHVNHGNPPNRVNNDLWDDEFEHMEINIAMDELLGLRGDFMVLFRNVSWLLAFNGAYLGLFAFIPYTLGSTMVSATAKILSSLFTISLMGSEQVTDTNLPSFFVRTLIQAIDKARTQGDCLQLVDLCTCMMGYVSICCTIVLWRWMVTTASSYIHRPLMGGVLWALRCLTAIVKVSTLLLLKMVVLPIVLGFGMDMATLRLFGVTLSHRIAFCMENMVASLLVHWVLGITFMLFVTVSVLQLREVLHPDILARVIRPQEAHPDLLRSLLSETCVKHARRIVLSLCIYALLLLLLVYVPIHLFASVFPHHFPLVLRFQHYVPELQVPFELLVVHLVVLGVLENAKNAIGYWQHQGMVNVARLVGLTEYLLPRIEVNWTDTRVGVQRGDLYVLPPPPLHFHPHVELPPEALRVPGHRYLPWPEEGPTLGPRIQTEYEHILPCSTPTHVSLRLAALCCILWVVVVENTAILVFGTFYLGRVCLGPFERISGITHDPLALAAGVQIVWYIATSIHAFNVLSMPEDRVELALVQRGYCIKNLTPYYAIASALGWVVVIPFLVGCIPMLSYPDFQWTVFETYWVGYLLFNLFAWGVCCFDGRGRRHRRRNGRGVAQGPVVDDAGAFPNEELEEEEEDENEEDEDEVARVNGAAGVPVEEQANVFVALRTSYKQLRFNLTVHDNDAVRLRTDNIRDRCLDLEQFFTNVVSPIAMHLIMLVVWGLVESAILIYLRGDVNPHLHTTAFFVSVMGLGVPYLIYKAQEYIIQAFVTFAENIRNERYLVGRELQDMAR